MPGPACDLAGRRGAIVGLPHYLPMVSTADKYCMAFDGSVLGPRIGISGFHHEANKVKTTKSLK